MGTGDERLAAECLLRDGGNRPNDAKVGFAAVDGIAIRSHCGSHVGESVSIDADLTRLAYEYLPLTFSRRHGDPSRPWNRFEIRVRDQQGNNLLGFQGNWRDIVVFICAVLFTIIWWNVSHSRSNWLLLFIVMIVLSIVAGIYAARGIVRALGHVLRDRRNAASDE